MTILTTHVGSLPRPKIVSELLFKREKEEEYNLQYFEEVISKSVEEVVKKQLDVGVDIISDGEMSKISYATYVKDRYNGFAGDSDRNPPQDLEKFPNYMKKIADSGGTPTYSRPCCVAEISSKKNNDLRSLTLAYNHNGQLVPYYAYGWEDTYLKLNEADKVISVSDMYGASASIKLGKSFILSTVFAI